MLTPIPTIPGQESFLRKIRKGLTLDQVLGTNNMPDASRYDEWMRDAEFAQRFQTAHEVGVQHLLTSAVPVVATDKPVKEKTKRKPRKNTGFPEREPRMRFYLTTRENPKDGLQRIRFVGSKDPFGDPMNFSTNLWVAEAHWDKVNHRVNGLHPDPKKYNQDLDWFVGVVTQALGEGWSIARLRAAAKQPRERNPADQEGQEASATEISAPVLGEMAPFPQLIDRTPLELSGQPQSRTRYVVGGVEFTTREGAVLQAVEWAGQRQQPMVIERHEIFVEGTFTPGG